MSENSSNAPPSPVSVSLPYVIVEALEQVAGKHFGAGSIPQPIVGQLLALARGADELITQAVGLAYTLELAGAAGVSTDRGEDGATVVDGGDILLEWDEEDNTPYILPSPSFWDSFWDKKESETGGQTQTEPLSSLVFSPEELERLN